MADASPPGLTVGEIPSKAEFRDLLKRAARGDRRTLPVLRRLLDAGFKGLGVLDIAGIALEDAVGPQAGRSLVARELLVRRIREVAAELAGPAATPIERLLADRAAFCWHTVHAYERAYAEEGLTIRQSEFHRRRVDAAHRRYLSSLKALAAVRKLGVPVLQINLAREQVNIVGPPAERAGAPREGRGGVGS